MTYLGIDYGLAKIGLALSEGELANPLPILKVKDPVSAKTKILTLIETNKIETIVFGIPHPDSIGAEKFADDLVKNLPSLKLVKVDETMTSNLAKAKTKKGKAEDSIVAAQLLQEYLDRKEFTTGA